MLLLFKLNGSLSHKGIIKEKWNWIFIYSKWTTRSNGIYFHYCHVLWLKNVTYYILHWQSPWSNLGLSVLFKGTIVKTHGSLLMAIKPKTFHVMAWALSSTPNLCFLQSHY